MESTRTVRQPDGADIGRGCTVVELPGERGVCHVDVAGVLPLGPLAASPHVGAAHGRSGDTGKNGAQPPAPVAEASRQVAP
jgi:hypothetical protein